jgi:predicted GIY-YIG superfamily endonuclease
MVSCAIAGTATAHGCNPLFDNPWFVYILTCGDGTHYVGCTSDLNDRLQRHANGWVPATKGRLPVTLLVYHVFGDKHYAFSFEKYLKSGSGRAFAKRHLIPRS